MSKEKVDAQVDKKNKELQESSTNYNKVVDNQRKYFKALKDFQEECDLNEELMQEMQKLKT